MKRLVITIFLLFPVLVIPATHYVSANTGNNGNDGTSWAQAWLTLGQLNGNVATGDSVITEGNFAETFSPTFDGESGNKFFLIDSLAFTDGWNQTNPDTAKIWSTIIDGAATRATGIDISGDDF